MPEIARLEPVELRAVWPNEATDFTPWLLGHLDALGDQIGLELEPLQREASVGRYSLDILAKDINGNRSVVIENQLQPTDHDHLGKVLTYAAGYNADVVVWVVKEFLDEHRQALDWLNQRTGLDTEFYGVVVRAVRIGDSPPAPIFEVVARPNEFRKRSVNVADRPITAADRAYQQFFQSVADRLASDYGHQRRSAGHRTWMDYRVDRVTCRMSYGRQQFQSAIYITDTDKSWNKAVYDHVLSSAKDVVDSHFEEPVVWDRNDNKKSSLIGLRRAGNIEDAEDRLSEAADWMARTADKLIRAVAPVVREAMEEVASESPEDFGGDAEE